MKKLLFSIAFLCAMFSTAQTIETKSSCDSNTDGKVDVTDVSNTVNKALGHEYVDLGLSVKWATMNVGATEVAGSKTNSHTGKLDCYGEYYAWGETSPKDSYSLSTYTLCNFSHSTMTKYCNSLRFGTVDNKTTLELSDDAAHANWGGSWRMPTLAEMDELEKKCTWTWTTQNGVTGYKVTGTNGNSIFLPAAGYRDTSRFYSVGSFGGYWTSSLDENLANRALKLYSDSGGVRWDYDNRYYGFSVRPVCP